MCMCYVQRIIAFWLSSSRISVNIVSEVCICDVVSVRDSRFLHILIESIKLRIHKLCCMARRINFYSQLVISLIGITDITKSVTWKTFISHRPEILFTSLGV